MRRRSGFTLVELLVAMTLIVFMMLILSQAFSVGLDSFRRVKAVGDMNARMRAATGILRRDLQADHFEGKRRLSSATFWSLGPPREGFFRIWQGSPAVNEGNDGDGLPSTRATDHILHFTVKLRGNERHDFLSAQVPAGSPLATSLGRTDSRYQDGNDNFNSQWFEVAYFLRRNGNTAGSTPLYALYRRQKLVMPESPDVRRVNWSQKVPATDLNQYREVSCKANPQDLNSLYFNSPTELTVPQRRFGMDPTQNGGLPTVRTPAGFDTPINSNDPRTWTYPTLGEENPALEGNDLLLPDVLSFEVEVFAVVPAAVVRAVDQIATAPAFQGFVDLFHSYLQEQGLMDNPLFSGANQPRVFDTWTDDRDEVYNYSAWSDQPPGTAGQDPTTRVPFNRRRPSANPTGGLYGIVQITGLKITLRVWDVKTQQARQVTLIQDL